MRDEMDRRTRALLEAPITPTLLWLAWPNMLVMAAQAAVGLVETYFMGKLGTDALAGVALVFAVVMMMRMMSAGAIGWLALRWSGGLSLWFANIRSAGKALDSVVNCATG